MGKKGRECWKVKRKGRIQQEFLVSYQILVEEVRNKVKVVQKIISDSLDIERAFLGTMPKEQSHM